jgi:lipoprotein-anchoring transpeptidase ErfK/SrfK
VTDENGTSQTRTTHFRTESLTLDQQTYPSIAPLSGQTVGIGMPVIVKFDVPVTDRASIEKNLHVVSKPAQKGSWHWISDNEVHWRPASYWKPGTKVTVNADINGVPAGHGIFGQLDRSSTFTIGASHVYKVNIQTDQLKVYDNGHLTRTIPITTGMPGFTTRSGTKVIIEKDRFHTMNSETIGIDPNSAQGYNIKDVEYAMRLTYSGEFLHAAPWSVAYQGHSNVSHGCTGMSTANAGWLYHHSQIGDVVEYTGSSKMMTLTNGYGDWNEPFSQYKTGSAL